MLLHAGDFLGNYGDLTDSLAEQLLDFAAWLHELHARFKHIYIIPGNHDTLLDSKVYPNYSEWCKTFQVKGSDNIKTEIAGENQALMALAMNFSLPFFSFYSHDLKFCLCRQHCLAMQLS